MVFSQNGARCGEGGGWGGTGKGNGKSMRTRLSKLSFSKLPSGFPQKSPSRRRGQRMSKSRKQTGLYLVAPCRAILRYCRCDTPYRAILFREVSNPLNGAIPPPPWHFVSRRHICANISRDACAITHKNHRLLAILSLQVSHDT